MQFELGDLEKRGELDVAEERSYLIDLTLAKLKGFRSSKTPLRTLRVLSQARAIFGFVLGRPRSIQCYFSDTQTQRIVSLMVDVLTQVETDFYWSVLKREAQCEGMNWIQLILTEDRSGGCVGDFCPAPAAPPNPRPPGYLEVTMEDFPFYPNGGALEQPAGVCWGMTNYALHMARNFLFFKRGRRPSNERIRALFDYDVLMDATGHSLKAKGFKFDRRSKRFVIPGFSNLRELTALHPEYLTLLENTYFHFQGKPGWGPLGQAATAATQRVLLDGRTQSLIEGLQYGMQGFRRRAQEFFGMKPKISKVDAFDQLREQTEEHGTIQVGIHTSGGLVHSVLVRASLDRATLLVIDPNFTFSGRYLHLVWRKTGIFMDGYAPNPTPSTIWASAPAAEGHFYTAN
ncbi:MAG: hypothetical protein V1798_07515 [Pseudomonadota bacterium]